MTDQTFGKLSELIPNIVKNEPLAQHSTIHIGGPAAAFVIVKTTAELIKATKVALEVGIPYHVLGGGSNTLFSDAGFDGLVIKSLGSSVVVAGKHDELPPDPWAAAEVRHEAAHPEKYISFLDLNYEQRPGDTLVRAESGVNLTALIVRTLDAGLIGLEWFGGIPGVIGGAIYNNIHGGTHFIGDRVFSITVLGADGETRTWPKAELGLGYDTSRFHEGHEVIVNVNFLLTKASGPELERAEYTFREWVRRKSQMQPKLGSLGSTFQNITQAERERIGAPTTSAGWLIDQCGLKGRTVGQAQISNEHANFIVNLGQAKAVDVYGLVQLAKREVKKKFGVDLKTEIFLVGEFKD